MVKKSTDRKEVVGEKKVYARFSDDLDLFVNLVMNGNMVSSVSLSEDPPAAPFSKDHPYLKRIIVHIATGKDAMLDIPLEYKSTPFEIDVLEQLRKIPPGEVATYGEIAKRLGKPKASRAVGSACAKNPFTILVPCHRVVPSSGGVGNYSSEGGTDAKIKLLKREGALDKVKSKGTEKK
jgi:O-6-methylguanine DNA methyltransferase